MYSLTETSHLNTPDPFHDKLTQNTQSHNVKVSKKNIPGSVPLSEPTPKTYEVYSEPRPISYPSFTENHSVVLCSPADKPPNQQTNQLPNNQQINIWTNITFFA